MLNLKHLYYFHVFTQELSITKAAARLLISAPALSNQLKELENFLGFKLTKRTLGKFVMTENGQMVAHYAQSMFAVYEELRSRISSKDQTGTHFRVGIGENLGVQFSFDLLSLVVKYRLSEVQKVHITFNSASKILTGFKENHFNLILGDFEADLKQESTWASQLLSFPVRLFAPANLIASKEANDKKSKYLDIETMMKLANELKISIVLPAKNSVLRKETEHFFLNLKTLPDKTIECNNSTAIVQLIERGFAMGFVPTPCLLDFKSARRLNVFGPPNGYWNHAVSVLALKSEEKSITNISPLAEIFLPQPV